MGGCYEFEAWWIGDGLGSYHRRLEMVSGRFRGAMRL